MCFTFLLVIVAALALRWATLRPGLGARVGLHAATTSVRPVGLRVEAHGGHGLGSARDQESALCGSSDIGGR
jgi:prolyl oligopeptidase